VSHHCWSGTRIPEPLRLAPAGSGWLRLAPAGSGWLRLAPPGSGWLRLAPARSGWHRLSRRGIAGAYAARVAVGDRVDQYRFLIRQALRDLFDQREPFGRLALAQVLMLAGDTLVTISLAGSLFFSISPDEAKSKVFLYLVLTLAPFAVVAPLLGPLIDRTRGARRAMVVLSALARCAICPIMATDTHSLLLFPEAFLILVFSKLYLVTRGALVPEMAAAGKIRGTGSPAGGASGADRGAAVQGDDGPPKSSAPTAPRPAGWSGARWEPPEVPTFFHGEATGRPPQPEDVVSEGSGMTPGEAASGAARVTGFSVLNARLTLLGTLAGFVASIPGVILLKLTGASGVLVFDSFVFAAAVGAGLRLPSIRPLGRQRRSPRPATGRRPATGPRPATERRPRTAAGRRDLGLDRDLASLQPVAHPEVLFGLTTMSLIRGMAGFLVFLLAFGLRREHAALAWYGLALGASGAGALVGLVVVTRLRQRFREQQVILAAILLIAVAAVGAAASGTVLAEAALALFVGLAGALAQPSFDALTQRFVPVENQGRTFAKFATRQQLVWVVGAIIPVVVAFPFAAGDVVMASVAAAGGLFYATSRKALHLRAVPRSQSGPLR